MRLIARISDSIEDEVDGACEYAKLAMCLREEGWPNGANTVIEMARQEAKHSEQLHDIVVSMIQQTKSSGAEVPQGMLDVWQLRHGELVDKIDHAREEIALF